MLVISAERVLLLSAALYHLQCKYYQSSGKELNICGRVNRIYNKTRGVRARHMFP